MGRLGHPGHLGHLSLHALERVEAPETPSVGLPCRQPTVRPQGLAGPRKLSAAHPFLVSPAIYFSPRLRNRHRVFCFKSTKRPTAHSPCDARDWPAGPPSGPRQTRTAGLLLASRGGTYPQGLPSFPCKMYQVICTYVRSKLPIWRAHALAEPAHGKQVGR